MGLFGKIFNVIGQKKTMFEKNIIQNGPKYAGMMVAKLINEKITSKSLAKQFILEELDAARHGNHHAVNFVKQSGFDPNEYKDSMSRINWEGDKSQLENLQLFFRDYLMQIKNKEQMLQLSTFIVDEIMKIWKLGKYETEGNFIDFLKDKKAEVIEVWIDDNTNLMWQIDIDKNLYNWDEANQYVKEKNLVQYNGYSDWRLPEIEELEWIHKMRRHLKLNEVLKFDKNGIDPNDFLQAFYWSANTLGERMDKIINMNGLSFQDMKKKAWNICISSGLAGYDDKTDKQCVRLVRGDKSISKNLVKNFF